MSAPDAGWRPRLVIVPTRPPEPRIYAALPRAAALFILVVAAIVAIVVTITIIGLLAEWLKPLVGTVLGIGVATLVCAPPVVAVATLLCRWRTRLYVRGVERAIAELADGPVEEAFAAAYEVDRSGLPDDPHAITPMLLEHAFRRGEAGVVYWAVAATPPEIRPLDVPMEPVVLSELDPAFRGLFAGLGLEPQLPAASADTDALVWRRWHRSGWVCTALGVFALFLNLPRLIGPFNTVLALGGVIAAGVMAGLIDKLRSRIEWRRQRRLAERSGDHVVHLSGGGEWYVIPGLLIARWSQGGLFHAWGFANSQSLACIRRDRLGWRVFVATPSTTPADVRPSASLQYAVQSVLSEREVQVFLAAWFGRAEWPSAEAFEAWLNPHL